MNARLFFQKTEAVFSETAMFCRNRSRLFPVLFVRSENTLEHSMPIESNEPVSSDLDALFAMYGDMVYRLALVRTKSTADAEDVVQEVFLRCLKHNPVFESAEHQKAWLIKVTINCSKSLLGNAFRRHSVPEDAMGELKSEDETPDSTVYDAVLKLPDKYRTAIHLYYYEDYSVKEIAALMHTTESTVKSWLHRARGMLKETLGGEYDV